MAFDRHDSKTTYLVLCGLFAALMAVCSYIMIPLPFSPVPVNLGTLGVFLTAGLLGSKYGALSVAVYMLLGAAGLPVFAGFQAGFGVLAGPTGGFIWGYLAAVFLIGMILDSSRISFSPAKRAGSAVLCISTMAAGNLICYLLGTCWFMILMGVDLWAALTACVIPFIPGDIIKILAASWLVQRLRPLLR